jgi:prophage regulatory protein
MAETFLRLPQVMAQTGLCRSAVYALDGFPKPVKLGGRAVAWLESEIQSWIAKTIQAQRSAGASAEGQVN